MRHCSKPNCSATASVLLGYNYAERMVTLEDAGHGDAPPHQYALCVSCADKLTPPRGWLLDDLRSKPVLFLEEKPVHRPVGSLLD